MSMFGLKKKKTPRKGTLAYNLVGLSIKAAAESGEIKKFAEQAWDNCKPTLVDTAKDGRRNCTIQLTFPGSEGGNYHLRGYVVEHLILLGEKEDITFHRPPSCNDKSIRVSW